MDGVDPSPWMQGRAEAAQTPGGGGRLIWGPSTHAQKIYVQKLNNLLHKTHSAIGMWLSRQIATPIVQLRDGGTKHHNENCKEQIGLNKTRVL